MQVLLLGTGSADGWPNPFCTCASCAAARRAGVVRGQTAALVDDVLLLDCGPEAPRAAERFGHSLDRVRDVLLTHSHPDHAGPPALLWRHWADRAEPLTVHGPDEALDLCRPWVGPTDPVTFHPVAAGDTFRTSAHDVHALAANHGDAGSGPGLLWEVTDDHGERLLHATDTGWPSETTLAALTAQPYSVVLLEETYGDRGGLGDDHLDLDSFARLLAHLRSARTVTDRTQVVAIHLGHHNPAPEELDRRLAALGARAGRDGDLVLAGAVHRPAPRCARRTLVLGGARSGKSVEAERLLAARPTVTFVATGGCADGDDEWRGRVAQHRARRPATWRTLETTDVAEVIRTASAEDHVLVDCLTLWLTDRLDRCGMWTVEPTDTAGLARASQQLADDVGALISALRTTRAQVVVVSNEVGQGVVPATSSGRRFRDELGRLNAAVAAEVDQVTLMVAGQALSLKGTDW